MNCQPNHRADDQIAGFKALLGTEFAAAAEGVLAARFSPQLLPPRRRMPIPRAIMVSV
jgi:hypothetical protein